MTLSKHQYVNIKTHKYTIPKPTVCNGELFVELSVEKLLKGSK